MRGGTRQGWVWHGKAGVVRHGMARRSDARQCRHGIAWPGADRLGQAGQARRGKAGQGVARRGWARQARHGNARLGRAVQANDDGERPVAARKDGLHLNNAERQERESEE